MEVKYFRSPDVDDAKREELATALAWGKQRSQDAVNIAYAMLRLGKGMYRDTVPAKVKARRRAKNKVARAPRKANR